MNNDKKKQAFDKAVSQAVEYSFQGYTEEIKNAPNPEKALKKVIIELDKRLDNGGYESELAAFGKREYLGFTDSLCNEILSKDEPYPWQIVWREKNPDGWEVKDNERFDLFVCDKLKERLEALSMRYDSSNPFDELTLEEKAEIKTIADSIHEDNRSDYEREEVKMYLAVFKKHHENWSRADMKKHAVRFLNGNSAERLNNARSNILGRWGNRLHAQKK